MDCRSTCAQIQLPSSIGAASTEVEICRDDLGDRSEPLSDLDEENVRHPAITLRRHRSGTGSGLLFNRKGEGLFAGASF
jgi:hypothetical protein